MPENTPECLLHGFETSLYYLVNMIESELKMHTSRAARTIVVSCERSPHSARKVKVKACRKMRDHTLIMFCRLRRPLSGSVFIRCTSFSICQYVPYNYHTFIRGTQERMVEPEITYSVNTTDTAMYLILIINCCCN